jgi:hypothetical protein
MSKVKQQGFSLLKYDTPVLVSKTIGAKGGRSTNGSTSTSASSIVSGDMKQNDYLNSILPPREYQDMG